MITLLAAVTSTGAGTKQTITKGREEAVTSHTLQVDITGAPTAVSVSLEGSVDGTTFSDMGTHEFTADELTATTALFHVVNRAVPVVRANLTVLTGGATPTVTAYYIKGV